MKRFTALAAALTFSTGAAFAEPVQMTEAQMDLVTAGALVNVVAVDVLDINNNEVLNNVNVLNNNKISIAVPVNAAVAVGILGAAGAAAAQNAPITTNFTPQP